MTHLQTPNAPARRRTRRAGPPLVVALALVVAGPAAAQGVSSVNPNCPSNATKPLPPGTMPTAKVAPADAIARPGPFPDFGFMVSASEYHECWSDQPVFRLKTDYPSEKPEALPAFMEIDFRTDPQAYLMAVRDYAFAGNLPHWDPFQNAEARWYHLPWLHSATAAYPPNGGTEGFRGLIKEAPLSPGQLGPGQLGQDGGYSVYATTLVNEQAGWLLGRMWADPRNPDPRVTDARYGGGFPEGTVFAKLLFTDAPKGVDDLPFLENPLAWMAYITPDFWTGATREVTQVNLLQMDVAVRDSRAPVTQWVFGTFAYNGALNRENPFENLVPVGLMWGNDPDDTTNRTTPFPPTKTEPNPDLKETVIFESPDLPPQHLGWNGRLNGPADLNTTSCMSCHMAAQYPAVVSLVPDGAVPDGGPRPPTQGGSEAWMKWFQNIPAGSSMSESAYSTDFSFQVAIGLTNFFAARDAASEGMWAEEFELAPVPIQRGFAD
ncbi:hypothetical protein P2H44_22410 [Albimonas sp. CAU 1670]|uniref:hypothetical protein n=1 Tax=Albimonas sp. CAU 1670 TaxID=3032599 RepID=UPI0023DA3A9F|nr:hypothetical protein [Albimonas sp. CAU 1670]MDF2235321.1 hypothetical protein [Albimonas sp. CAU 1670]